MDMFETLKPLLAEPSFTPDTLELRETVCVFANQAFAQIAAAGPVEKAQAEAQLRQLTANAAQSGNAFLLTLLSGLLYAANGEIGHLKESIRAALSEEITDVGVGMNNLYMITRLDFVDMIAPEDLEGLYDYEARHRYWSRLVDLAETQVTAADIGRKTRFSDNDRVLILTDQFLQPPHAPTKDAVEYGKLFQEAGKDVMIVSTCAYGQQLYSAIMPGSRCAVNEPMGAIPAFEFEGHIFKYHQPPSGRFNNGTLLDTLAVIEAFDPALVLAIGGQSLVGELLSSRSFLVQYPTFAGLPTTRNFHFFTWRPLEAHESGLLERLGLAENHLFSHHPGFEPPERLTRLTREQFSIPAEAFVFAVVGMRLDFEITGEFLALIRDIRGRRPNAHFLFVGKFDAFQTRIADDPSLAGAATYIGYQSDIIAAYELCDAFINPTRKGGGSAIVHALTAGLPALSVNFGDAYEAVREFPLIEDYAALARIACDLADRSETYESYVTAVKRTAPALQGKAAVVGKLLAAYDRFRSEQAGID